MHFILQRPKTITDQEREYKHHSDGFEEPLYYTLENVNPCPIRPLSNHVVSRDSQYSTQSSLSRVSFPGRISLGLSETIMSEYPFLRQESCHIFQDELKREETSGSAISTSVWCRFCCVFFCIACISKIVKYHTSVPYDGEIKVGSSFDENTNRKGDRLQLFLFKSLAKRFLPLFFGFDLWNPLLVPHCLKKLIFLHVFFNFTVCHISKHHVLAKIY